MKTSAHRHANNRARKLVAAISVRTSNRWQVDNDQAFDHVSARKYIGPQLFDVNWQLCAELLNARFVKTVRAHVPFDPYRNFIATVYVAPQHDAGRTRREPARFDDVRSREDVMHSAIERW